ncbi:hypothetical protein ElyMa_003232000 [Elysia marginata]|uniref:Uncharacterized protein n=1 Tax=Elysia marginata TaxID=1093978 RepID=A0AAV4J4D6_9GAST|nr:hypothetical protein ElyMa_003232000 [Elysia marginata]
MHVFVWNGDVVEGSFFSVLEVDIGHPDIVHDLRVHLQPWRIVQVVKCQPGVVPSHGQVHLHLVVLGADIAGRYKDTWVWEVERWFIGYRATEVGPEMWKDNTWDTKMYLDWGSRGMVYGVQSFSGR